MRLVLHSFSIMVLAGMLCAARPAHADSCSAIESQLRSVSRELSHGDIAGAEKALGLLAAAAPDCADLVLDRARMQAVKGESGAEDTFSRYNTLRPKDAKGWAYYARLLIDEGEYQRAEAASRIASECDPADPIAIAVQGQIVDMQGASQEGMQLLEQAIRLDPDDAEASFQLGGIHDRAQHPARAVEYFTKAAKIRPSDARAWDYLALNLEPLGEIDRAQYAYRRGLAENRPGAYFDAFLPYNYGRFLMKRNQLSASKEQLDRAVESTSQVRAPWYERARLNLLLKNYQQARTDAEKAASLEDPQGAIANLQVYALLEQIYSRLGETDLARKYAELDRVTPAPVQSEIDRTH